MKHEVIQFIDVKELPTTEQAVLHDLSTEYYEKIRRSIKNLTSLVVHLKEYKKDGNRHKYVIHLRAISPSHTFTSTKAADWDLARTTHKAFDDVLTQIQHKLHSDQQKPTFQSGESQTPRKRS